MNDIFLLNQLILKFKDGSQEYHSSGYKEAHLRQEFLDPFFEILGWDIRNEKNASEIYKEVIFEESIKVSSSIEVPDYCFRLGGKRKFLVEAKKPNVKLADNSTAAYQIRRYGWSANLPVSILTNFEEFAVYDCRIKPSKNDRATKARLLYLTYEQYQDRWQEIQSLFARDVVMSGSLERLTDVQRKGINTVDNAFLKEIENWREQLAVAFSQSNPHITQRQLNFTVQITINRLIFLRIAEDRGIEPYGKLKDLLKQSDLYAELGNLFRYADDRYNSGLFHFKPEKNRSDVDDLTLGLKIPNQPLQAIIEDLYYPNSPYAFSIIPIEILGQVYEQFLGKVIRLTSDHQAIVEDKPEVKKAGGVYYTPTYIVDYIVEKTVHQWLIDKTPKQAEKLTILDPACGSGSFLIGVYQYLLNWYLTQYLNNVQKYRKKIYQADNGEYRLTSDEKKKILLNNIYGVDIDPQAVETTKLSLLLKVLEGESDETITRQLNLLQERALPDLDNNIKCGNSLISPEYCQSVQISLLDEEEFYRINVFDWKESFPQVIKSGGFDIIVGNPPYIRIQDLRQWAPIEANIYKDRYQSATKGSYDIYVIFVEKSLQLLNYKGVLGLILSHKFFKADYGYPLRCLIEKGKHLKHLVYFGDQQVFKKPTTYTKKPTTYTCLMFLEKSGCDFFTYENVKNLKQWVFSQESSKSIILSTQLNSDSWVFCENSESASCEKLNNFPDFLDELADIWQGIRTSANPIYVLSAVRREASDDLIYAFSKRLNKEVCLEQGVVFPFLDGEEIRAYSISTPKQVVIIPYETTLSGIRLISVESFQSKFPRTFEYLKLNEDFLRSRENGKMDHEKWYGYVYPKNIKRMKKKKILTPDIASQAPFALDLNGEYAFVSGYGITLKDNVPESIEYLLVVPLR
jgi:predicted type IV restriction endonuclease